MSLSKSCNIRMMQTNRDHQNAKKKKLKTNKVIIVIISTNINTRFFFVIIGFHPQYFSLSDLNLFILNHCCRRQSLRDLCPQDLKAYSLKHIQ